MHNCEVQQMSAMLSETLISLSAAARRLPCLRGDSPVSPTTLWRWHAAGVRAADGSNVRLEVYKLGGRTCTSIEALDRFVAKLNAMPAPASAADTEHAKSVADQLDALGL
jgi:hypothetical protein